MINRQPMLLSILFGITVVFAIGAVSLSIKLKKEVSRSNVCFSENMKLQKIIQGVEREKISLAKSDMDLKEELEQDKKQIVALKKENERLESEIEKMHELNESLKNKMNEKLTESSLSDEGFEEK